MTSTVQYTGELRTSCLHLRSNEQLITDAPTDNNGKGQSFSPTDLVATALASCMLTIMGIQAKKMQITLAGTKASVNKIMAANPRRISKIEIDISFPKNNWDEKIKKQLKTAALNCPVAKSIHQEIIQDIVFRF